MMSFPVILAALIAMIAVMTLAWIVQRKVGNSGWIDVFWTLGTGAVGVAAALLPPGPDTARQLLVAGLVAVWSLRLGAYVAVRVARSDEDARYARFREEWGAAYQRKLFAFVLPQAVVTAILCLSIQAAAHRPLSGLDLRDGLAIAVLLIAIGGEALADRQLSTFKAERRSGGIMDRGLWAWSRHPNYFFEWFGWLAYPVMAFEMSRPMSWLTLAAPAAMYLVLRFLTGVRPLEETMLASRGDAYRAYQARTSAFLLLPPKHGARA